MMTNQRINTMNVIEIYKQEPRYNPRIRATVGGAWIAVLDDGEEFPICADYQAQNEAEARLMLDK